MKLAKSSKKTKNSRSALRVEALESRQLLAGITGGGTEVLSDRFVEANGNTFDQVLMTGSSVTVTADAGQITRVSFLDLQGDIVQAEFSGKGTLSISLDGFVAPAEAAKYIQPGVNYVSGLATFTIQGSDASTNFRVFTVGSATAVNQALFDDTHTGGNNVADVARLAIVADPSNFGGSNFGSILAGNANFSAASGTVGISAANVNVQGVVRVGEINATGTATPSLVLGANSQFVDVEVTGGNLVSDNGKAINNNGSFEYGIQFLDGTTSFGVLDPKGTAGGQTFTANDPFGDQGAKVLSLTTLNDVGSAFTGSANDDTFIGAIGSNGLSSNNTTLNAGDSFTGGLGTDTLSLSIAGTNSANTDQTTASFTATGIEAITVANFQSDDTSNSVLDLALVPNIASISIVSTSASGDTSFTNVRNLVAAAMQNGSGDLSLSFVSAATTGSSTALSLSLSAQTGGTFTAAGVETLNITSGGASNTVTLVGANLGTINIAGDKNVTLGTVPGSVSKVDASGLTAGRVSLTGGAVKDYNITGGAGNDVITLANFTADDSVNGGEGADRLSVDNAGAIDAGLFAGITNVETLALTGAGVTLTLEKNIVPTTFDLSNAGAQTVELKVSVPNNTAYTNATTVILSEGGGGDKVDNQANVTLTVEGDDADFIAGTTITGGSGTDSIVLNGTGATATISNVSKVETITVVGDDTTIDFAGAGGVVASGKTLTIDASGSDGKLTLTGTQGETDGWLNVTGTAGNDDLKGGSEKDTLNGGAGNDTFRLGSVKATNIVTGGAGADTLAVTGSIDSDTRLAGVTGVETLKLDGAVNLTLAAPITATTGIATIDASNAANNVITLDTGYTGALTVKLTGDGGGDKIVNAANVDLTVNAKVGDVLAGTTITGGTGADVINLTASAGTADLTDVTGVEQITVKLDAADPTLDAIIVQGTGNIAAGKTLVVDASAFTVSSATLTYTGNAAEADGFVNVTGGVGVDNITGGGSGFDTLSGGDGNDSLSLAKLEPTNIIDGGAGTDTLKITGTDISTSSAFLGVKNVENLVLFRGVDLILTSNIKTATGISSINTANGDALDTVGTIPNVVTLQSGVTDSVALTVGASDTVNNTANTTLSVTATTTAFVGGTTVTVAGGTGTDTITLNANNIAAETVSLAGVSGVETITVADPTANNQGITVNLGGVNTVVAAGKTLTVTASGLDSAEAFSFDGSADTDGHFVVTGGAGADTFVGGGAADTFTGGSGADTFGLAAHANKLTFDTVTDVATGEKLLGTDTVGADTFVQTKITLGSLATFSDYLDAAATNGNIAGSSVFRWFQFGGNTYVVQDVSASDEFVSNLDRVIELQGLKDLSTTVAADNNGLLTLTIV